MALSVMGHTIGNIDSIRKQIQARGVPYGSVLDSALEALTYQETDYIDFHLGELSKFNGTKCQKCHNKMKYTQTLVKEDPDQQHLVSLMLYEYCLTQNSNKDSKCEFVDFFVTTNTYNSREEDATTGPTGAFDGATSVNFFDNDFLSLIINMNTTSNLTLDYYCYYKGGYCDLPETPDLSEIIDLDSMWPEKTAEQELEPAYEGARELFNVLHVSDFHNELRYEVGSEANCSQGLCCLPESYNTDLTSLTYNFTSVYKKAGASDDIDLSFYPYAHYDDESGEFTSGDYYDFPLYRGWNFARTPASTFGNYACDPPEVLLNNSLIHISNASEQNAFEFSIFTGDIVDHDVIHCDANVTLFAEMRSYKIMKHFLKNIPIFPTLGNHDTFPYGQLAPQKFQNVTFNESVYHWNEELVSELWISNGWLNESKKELTQHYAAFSTITDRGLKVISLNSNCYYQKNLYAYIDIENEPDLFGQWEFLINELVESEKIGQRVWILAHIPAGDTDVLPIQSNIFAKIVERFSPYTIANIFYGHTHKDQFKILYSENDQEPVNMAWVSQAITPLGPANPSWRYYEVEDKSFNILNAFNYYSPLNETWVNGAQEPTWKYEYSPRSIYDPQGDWPTDSPLNATFWDQFVLQKLRNLLEVEFNQLYTDFMYRNNPYVPSCKNGSEITDDCYEENYCYNVGFKVDDYYKCIE